MDKKTTTTGSSFEKQWKLANSLNLDFYPQLIEKATELGITVVQVHDSLTFSGPPDQVEELLTWIKEESNTILKKRRLG